jgi:hypothetical protein
MSSFIQPVRPIDTAPPWNWNPGQTFVDAFNESRLTKAKADQLQMEAELEQLLFPVAQKKAALELDKMQFEVERQSLMLDMARDAQRQVHRSQMSGLTGGGGGGNNAPATNAQGFQSKFGWGSKIATPPQAASRPKPTWQVVAPAQPTP